MVNDSILATVRQMIGGAEDDTAFDLDLILFINTCLTNLFQIGIGDAPFAITGEDETWSDFLGSNIGCLAPAQTYIVLKTKLYFDQNSLGSSTVQSMERQISEAEWRIYVATNPRESILGSAT